MSSVDFNVYHFLTLTVHSKGGYQSSKEDLAPIYLIYRCCGNEYGTYEKAKHRNRHDPIPGDHVSQRSFSCPEDQYLPSRFQNPEQLARDH